MVAGKSSGLVLDVRAASGGTFVDRSRFHHTITNTAVKTTKGLGDELAGLYDGSTSYLNCGSNVRPTSAISVEAWLNPNDFKEGAGVAISSGRSGGILLFYPAAPNVSFSVYTTVWNSVSIPQIAISLNIFHHFVLTYDQTNLKIFMDGIEKTSLSVSGNITYDGKPFIIGGYVSISPPYTPTIFFNGIINEVRVWNRALSAGEIAKLYLSKAALLRL